MIRIERGNEVKPGTFSYNCLRYPLVCGKSRQPILDACRQLKSLYGVTAQAVGGFRNGSAIADLSCPVDVGAAYTVSEQDKHRPKFIKFKEFNGIPPKSAENS